LTGKNVPLLAIGRVKKRNESPKEGVPENPCHGKKSNEKKKTRGEKSSKKKRSARET